MSDDANPAQAVADELSEQVDVGSLLTGDDVSDQIDGESLGRSVGESLGSLVGRRIGRALGDRLLSKLSLGGDDDSERSLLGKVAVALGRTLQKPEFRDPIGDALRDFVEAREERLADAAEATEDAADEAAGSATEAAESASDTAAEAVDEVADAGPDVDVADLDSDDVQALREETYRDLLEMMDYSELQSIAKEVGVKANSKREKLIDDVVEQFGAEDEGSSDDGEED